jgi:hypothetical protein
MIVASVEEKPLTRVWKRLLDDEATLDVMIVDVPTDPPMFEVRTLFEEERVLEVLRVVIVADAAVKLVVDATVAERLEIVVEARADVPVA